jgi:bacterioferritin-associated ferredoxin
MYVCICNPVTDSQVRQAIDAGCSSLDDLQSKLGVAISCGRCSEFACEMLKELGRSVTSTCSEASCKL